MARYSQQRSKSLLHYGYKRGADGSYAVDPNNEYGAFQQMLKGESAQTHSLERAQHASGWGESSGFLGQARDELGYAQGGEQAQLGQGFQDELSQIDQGEADAAYNKDQALYSAQEQAAQDAINQQNFNPGDYGGLDQQVGYPAGTDQSVVPPKRRGAQHRQQKARLVQRQAARRARARAGRRR
jgi:hypothetical protein